MAVGLAENRASSPPTVPTYLAGRRPHAELDISASASERECDQVNRAEGAAGRDVSRLLETMRERWDILMVIAVGGAVGSLARWGVGEVLPHDASAFPVSTLAVNVLGSFLLGLLMVFVLEIWPPTRYVRPFIGVGVLGGFTTFSTFMFENRALAASGAPMLALVYIVATVVLVLVAVAAGVLMARAFAGAKHRHRHRRARAPVAPETD